MVCQNPFCSGKWTRYRGFASGKELTICYFQARSERSERLEKNMSRKPKRDAIPRNSREIDARETALAVLALARREKLSLKVAAEIEQIKPRTVLRYAGSGFMKRGGDYRAKPTDRIPRSLTILDRKGKRRVFVTSNKAATLISRYWHAVRVFQTTGVDKALKKFRKKKVPYAGFNFVTSPAKLKKFGDAGILDFEHFYWRGRVL